MAIQVGEGIGIAFRAIRLNKVRSFLTILGVIVGVTTIIAVVSIIEGLGSAVKGQLASIGTDVLYIRPFAPGVFVGGFPDSLRRRPWFEEEDAEAIRRHCPSVLAVAPLNFTESRLAYRENATRSAFVIGTTPDFMVTNNFAIEQGRFFTDAEVEHRAPVVILGPDWVEALFPHENVVGKTISIGGRYFTVIGTTEPRGKLLGQTLDDLVVVPLSTNEKAFGPRLRLVLNAKPVAPELLDQARNEMIEVLRRQRKLRYHQGDNFAVFTDQSLMDIYNQITFGFYVVMVIISSIALVVGGIGVMNIMLVSVTERTREIGLRKAMGARGRDVLWQFLVESVTLTGVGGVVGIGVGLGAGWLVGALTPLSFAVPLWGVALGFLTSTVVGLFFGMYPAVRASRLDPVEALRYE